ncbi:MAG: hypothetical protein OEM52_10790 [bacterium]|nr:hypothetical protein [bacterium]
MKTRMIFAGLVFVIASIALAETEVDDHTISSEGLFEQSSVWLDPGMTYTMRFHGTAGIDATTQIKEPNSTVVI